MMPQQPYPKEIQWLVEGRLIGEMPFSQLKPWHLVVPPMRMDGTLIENGVVIRTECVLFSRRQDNDDAVVFEIVTDRPAPVVLVNWTARGLEVVGRYSDVWEWLKEVVIGDIKACFEAATEAGLG